MLVEYLTQNILFSFLQKKLSKKRQNHDNYQKQYKNVYT